MKRTEMPLLLALAALVPAQALGDVSPPSARPVPPLVEHGLWWALGFMPLFIFAAMSYLLALAWLHLLLPEIKRH